MSFPIAQNNPFDAEAKLLRTIGLRPGMLDVGANTGMYSAILEDIVGAEALFLFEPLPHLYQPLKRRFKHAHVLSFGLSDKQKSQIIRVPYIGGKRCDTRATCNAHAEENQTGFDEIEVQFYSLDEIAKTVGFRSIGLIKVDVEGHELEVLNGAVETIARFKPLILIEIESRHHAFPIAKIFSKIEEFGYKGYYLNPEEYKLLKVEQFDSDRYQNQKHFKSRDFVRYLNNFLFVHHSSEEDFVSRTISFLESEKRLALPNS